MDHAHIFWYYPHVQPFREKVGRLISRILGFSVYVSFFSLSFGVILCKSDIHPLKIFMVANKKAVIKV